MGNKLKYFIMINTLVIWCSNIQTQIYGVGQNKVDTDWLGGWVCSGLVKMNRLVQVYCLLRGVASLSRGDSLRSFGQQTFGVGSFE